MAQSFAFWILPLWFSALLLITYWHGDFSQAVTLSENRPRPGLDYTRRAGWPEEPMFWIANTGFLFVNCQILGPRIKKIQKTLLFWNIFWSPNTGFLFVKRPNFESKTGSRDMLKNRICEGILTKTGEMSFYLKQLRDIQTSYEHTKFEASTQ